MSLDHIKGIIWDLDGTLYRYDEVFRHACNLAAARTAIDLGLDMNFDDAVALAAKSEREYGSSFKLFADHGLTYMDFHHPYHDAVDTTILQINLQMRDTLAALDMPMAILTNASRPWALRTVAHLQLNDLFTESNILAFEDVGHESKAAGPAGFNRALEIIGTKPQETLMVEDLARNLTHAKKLGMTTALVHHGKIPDDCSDLVDVLFADTLELARVLLQAFPKEI